MLKAQRKSSCGEKLKGLKGWGEYVVKEKLEGLKRKLKDWSKNVSCVEKSHFVLEKELNDLDKKEKMVGLEVDEVEKKKRLCKYNFESLSSIMNPCLDKKQESSGYKRRMVIKSFFTPFLTRGGEIIH